MTILEKTLEGVPATGPILRTDEAAAYIGLTTDGYYKAASRGVVPRPILIGDPEARSRATGVPRPWLDALIAAWAAAPAMGAAR